MPRSKILAALFCCTLAASLGAAQTDEWPSPPGGVDRASAAAKPNEAGALPESSPRPARGAPDGARDEETYGSPALDAPAAQEPAQVAAAAPAPESARELPRTASPLAVLTFTGLMALAAGGGLHRLRREPQ